MRVLTFTTLYPNTVQPNLGLFVEHRIKHLCADRGVSVRVVAPVPWFPLRHPALGRYATLARVPRRELRDGIEVLHPRFPRIPKIGMTVAPLLLARAMLKLFRRLADDGDGFDLIDAHFLYPDGVAAVMLGKWLCKPVVLTARGSDVHSYRSYRIPWALTLWATRRADAVVTVSDALAKPLRAAGVPDKRLTTLRNGVDLRLFQPVDRTATRARIGFRRPTLLSVGNLIELKGHDLVIRALETLADFDLVVIGSGPLERPLQRLAARLGVNERVRFLSPMPQEQLREYYGAADALVLASSREGWPNVLLEAMACGTPVVATETWGIPEIVTAPEAGVLIGERSVAGLVDACRRLFANYPERNSTRRYAERFGWEATSEGQWALFNRVLAKARVRPAGSTKLSKAG